jgi:hypothetical protein
MQQQHFIHKVIKLQFYISCLYKDLNTQEKYLYMLYEALAFFQQVNF